MDDPMYILLAVFVGERFITSAFSLLKNRGVDLPKMAKQISHTNGCVDNVEEKVIDLHTMHKYPDDHGFGSKSTNEKLDRILEAHEKSTQALSDLVVELRIARGGGQ